MALLSEDFPDFPVVCTVGLTNLPLKTEERAPDIIDFASSIRGARDGALFSPSFQRPQCMCRSFNCCLHGFGHAPVDDVEECSAHAIFLEVLPCMLRLVPKDTIRYMFYLFVNFLRKRNLRPRSAFMKLVLDAHLCEQKNVPRILHRYVLQEEMKKIKELPSKPEAVSTLLKYFSEAEIHQILMISHQAASRVSNDSSAHDLGRCE